MNPIESNGDEPAKPPFRRRTLQSKLLILLALLSSGMLLCCCIPLVALNFAFGPNVEHDPANVAAGAQLIAPIIVPPEFTGVEARSADNSMFRIQIVRFNHKEGRGRLVIGLFRTAVVPMGDEYDFTMLQKLVDQMFPGMRVLDVKDRREKEALIHGKKVLFEIQAGIDVASTTRLRQVSGSYTSPQGVVQLILQAEEGFITDAAIDSLIESLADTK